MSLRLSPFSFLMFALGLPLVALTGCEAEDKGEAGSDGATDGATDGGEDGATDGASDAGADDGAADGTSDGSSDGADTGEEPAEPVWSYEGETGPEHWGDLSEEWAACSEGEAQSPIDIRRDDIVPSTTTAPALSWGPTALLAYNSGHYIRYNVELGSSIEYGGRTYGLEQLHFHGMSEHTVEGEHFDMEVHFVHADLSDPTRLLVVAAFGQVAGPDDASTDLFSPDGALHFYDALGLPEDETPTSLDAEVDLGAAFPGLFDGGILSYGGSLTQPPCTEGVQFFIASAVLSLPPADMEAFLGVYDFNYRPVQPLNGRSLSFFRPL